jgi:hypothetical protein
MTPIANPADVHARSAQLALFIRGRLPGDQAASVCAHVLECSECQEHVHEITELLWPSLSIWIKCSLRLYSPSWPPSRVFRFLNRTTVRLRKSCQTG